MSSSESRPPLYLRCWPVVWLASWIVPSKKREDWRVRWRSQIWHWCAFLAESGRSTPQARAELSTYCWSAYADATYQRISRENLVREVDHTLRSPQFCLGLCLSAVLAVILVSGFLPVTKSLFLPTALANPQRILTVSRSTFLPFRTGVPAAWVHMWQQESSTTEGVATYVFERPTAQVPGAKSHAVLTQRVSSNFFDLLGVSSDRGHIFHAGDESACANCVVLSHKFWRNRMGGDPNVVGRELLLNQVPHRIIGVMPSRFWFASGETAAWTVAVPNQPTSLGRPPRLLPAVVRLKTGVSKQEAQQDLHNLAQLVTPLPIGPLDLDPVKDQARNLLYPFAIAISAGIFLAFVITRFRLSEIAQARKGNAWRWWGFLIAKSGLLALAAFLAAVESTAVLAALSDQSADPSVWPIAAWLALVFTVTVLYWSLSDQRIRCRSCLTRLGLPAVVGSPGHMLFDPSATELVCPNGHGMLLISDMECSWIEAEHWTGLDDSWRELFREE